MLAERASAEAVAHPAATSRDDTGEAPYPQAPWRLGGRLLGSVFALPPSALPPGALMHVPPGARPLEVAGRLPVAVAFAEYAPGGVLDYSELLVALPIRSGLRLTVTIPAIWVDREQSQLGARALWGIPKELARFTRREAGRRIELTAFSEGRHIASLSMRQGWRMLPGWQPFTLTTRQRTDAGVLSARNLVVSHAKVASAGWSFNPDGPLGYLAGRKQLGSAALTDLTVAFGLECTRA